MPEVGAQLKIGADATEYNKVVSGMPATMSNAIGRIQKTLDFSLAAMAMRSVLEKMDDIDDASKRIGASAEDVQKIGGAAKFANTNLEAVDRAIRAITVSAKQASEKGGDALEKFKSIGIDPGTFSDSSISEKINILARAQEEASKSAGKMADYWDAIGVRAGGIDFASIASNMGNIAVASDSTVKRLADANDELVKAQNNATLFGAGLLHYITRFSEMLGAVEWNVWAKLSGQQGYSSLYSFDKNGRSVINSKGEKVSFESIFGYRGDSQQNTSVPIEPQDGKDASHSSVDKSKSASSPYNEDKAYTESLRSRQSELEIQSRREKLTGNKDAVRSLEYQLDVTKNLIKYEGDYNKAVDEANISLAERDKSARESEKKQKEQNKERQASKIQDMADRWREMRGKHIPGPTITPADYMADIGTRSGFDGPDQIYRSGAAANMRISGRYQRMMDRAAEYEGRGAYNSAAGLQDRAAQYLERENRKAMDRLDKQVDNAMKSLGESGLSAEEKDKRKTRYEELQKKHDAASGGGGGAQSVEMTTADILKEMRARLPISVMGTN